LEPQAFDVLAYLVSHRDRVVPKEELMDGVWGGRFVSETAVTSRIKQVRRALGDDGHSQRMIRTQHGRGYRFVAPVEARRYCPRPEPIRYTVSDGLHIAYQVTGGGPLDIVLISGFVSHLELDWGDPRHAHFLHRLGSFGRLIRFDKRGTGMSDRPSGLPDVETRMHDVLSVMDAVGRSGRSLVGTRRAARWRSCPPRPTRTRRRARAVRDVAKRVLVGGLSLRAGGGSLGRLRRGARHPLGLGGGHADALPVRGRADAAVVGAAHAGRGDAVDSPGADEHERTRGRPGRAARRTGPDPGPAPAG
jgi:hypothetical protein